MFLSEEIDLEYERDGEMRNKKVTEANKCVEAEMEYIFGDEEENDIDISNKSSKNSSIHNIQEEPKTNLSLSMTRSGACRVTCSTHTIGIQNSYHWYSN